MHAVAQIALAAAQRAAAALLRQLEKPAKKLAAKLLRRRGKRLTDAGKLPPENVE